MPSLPMKNRRRALALERMNIAAARLANSHDFPLLEIPKRTRDKEMREILAFERVSSLLESLLGQDAPLLENHPLVQKQSNRGIRETDYVKHEPVTVSGPKTNPESKVPQIIVNKVASPKGKPNGRKA